MDDQLIHILALAYAKTKLQESQKRSDQDPLSCDSDELRSFLKAYNFALENIPSEWEEIG